MRLFTIFVSVIFLTPVVVAKGRMEHCKVRIKVDDPCAGLNLSNTLEDNPHAVVDPYAKDGLMCDFDFNLPSLPTLKGGKFNFSPDLCKLGEDGFKMLKKGVSFKKIKKMAKHVASDLKLELPKIER